MSSESKEEVALGKNGKRMDSASKVECAEQVTSYDEHLCLFFFLFLIVSFAMSWHEQRILYSGKSAKTNTSLQLRNTVWKG